MAEVKKYYWLKLQKDFFKRHDIRIIEEMPNGKDYILFYMKLLVESITHNGNLRFSESIPYNDTMLATITNTNIDIVRSAVKLFSELKLMEMMDDGTFYMSEINKMIGSETEWADKKRLYREKQLLLEGSETTVKGQKKTLSDKSKSKSKSKSNKKIKDLCANNFSLFWDAYPKKRNKGDAEKAWEKLKLDKPLYRAIMDKLEESKMSHDWIKDKGQYIPYPASWLNAKGWQDELPGEQPAQTNAMEITDEQRAVYAKPYIRRPLDDTPKH